jgi:hypothetical protein
MAERNKEIPVISEPDDGSIMEKFKDPTIPKYLATKIKDIDSSLQITEVSWRK